MTCKIIKMLCTALAVCLTAAGTAYSQNAKTAGAVEAELVDAVAEIEADKYKQAMERLEKITASDPSCDAAYYYLGLCRVYTKDIEGAKTAFKKAAELDPKNFWYKERLARVYSMDGEDDLTVATYEDLLKEFPKSNDIYFTLVNLYLKQGDLDKALEALDQIDAVFGKSENVTATRYDILLHQKKPEEALKALEDYNKDFSSPYVLTKLGDHSLAEDKDTAAFAYYKEALELQGDYTPALLGEAEVYRLRRDDASFYKILGTFIDNAETPVNAKTQYLDMLVGSFRRENPQVDTLFDKLVACHPSDSSALTSAAIYWFASKRTDKAGTFFRRNMELHPESFGTSMTYLQYLTEIQDWKALGSAADTLVARFPDSVVPLDYKNVACYNTEDWQGLLENSQKMIEVSQGDSAVTVRSMATIGDIHHQLGDDEKAFKAYEKVLKLNPDYAPALNNYAYYLALKGRKLKKACAMSKKTIEQNPDNSTYLDTYGWILHLLGRDKEAKAQFKHAMLYGAKDSVESLEHYAAVLEALGETDLAKVYRREAANKKAESDE